MDDAPLLAEQRHDELEQERLARQHEEKGKAAFSSSHGAPEHDVDVIDQANIAPLPQQQHQQERETPDASSSSHDALPEPRSAVPPEHDVIAPEQIASPERRRSVGFNSAVQDLETSQQFGQVREGPGRPKRVRPPTKTEREPPTDFDPEVTANLPLPASFSGFPGMTFSACELLYLQGISFDNSKTHYMRLIK